MTPRDDLTASLSSALLESGWRRVKDGEAAFRRRYREPAGSYGVLWTKAVIVLTADPEIQLDAFTTAAWNLALGQTRWMLPPRGVQGGTLVLPVFVGVLSPTSQGWATSQPRVRFATMCAPAAVDAATKAVLTNREVPRLGAGLHRRRLGIADQLMASFGGSAAA